jgi:hypothetical protein
MDHLLHLIQTAGIFPGLFRLVGCARYDLLKQRGLLFLDCLFLSTWHAGILRFRWAGIRSVLFDEQDVSEELKLLKNETPDVRKKLRHGLALHCVVGKERTGVGAAFGKPVIEEEEPPG